MFTIQDAVKKSIRSI